VEDLELLVTAVKSTGKVSGSSIVELAPRFKENFSCPGTERITS
jgi:hypothetical protein